MPRKRVFVDTNAIFPAVKIGEWNRLCGHFSVETVETVVNETQNGDVNRPGYIRIDKAMLEANLNEVHRPTKEAQAAFQLKAVDYGIELDDGERDLLAYLMANEKLSPNILVLTVADRAAIRAACRLGWGESMVSLERLLSEAGAPRAALKNLEDHFREPWLAQVRTNFLLGLVK